MYLWCRSGIFSSNKMKFSFCRFWTQVWKLKLKFGWLIFTYVHILRRVWVLPPNPSYSSVLGSSYWTIKPKCKTTTMFNSHNCKIMTRNWVEAKIVNLILSFYILYWLWLCCNELYFTALIFNLPAFSVKCPEWLLVWIGITWIKQNWINELPFSKGKIKTRQSARSYDVLWHP